MRILFTPSGVGLGHVGRCIPLARKLHRNGAEILFSTYREGYNFVVQEGFQAVRSPDIGVAVKPDGTIDFRKTTVNPGPFLTIYKIMQQVDAEINIIQGFKPDIVISDSRASSLLAAQFVGIPRICILNQFQVLIPAKKRFLRLARIANATTLTLVGKIWADAIQALIPDFPPPYTISTQNLHIPKSYHKKTRFIGPILPVRPDELQDKETIRKKLGLEVNKPIIFAPISGPAKERAYFTGILRKIFTKLPNSYKIVMSLGYPGASAEPVTNGNMIIYGWIPNRFEYLKACDVVISRGGHGTLLQSICYGKPLILVPTPSHTEQHNNARKAVDLGIAEVIQQEDLDSTVLLGAVKKVLEKGRFQENAEELRKNVLKWNGLETAVNIICQLA